VIHLIGVNHRVQWEKPSWVNAYVPNEVKADQAQYRALIEDFLRDFHPSRLAEEYTESKLKDSNALSILLTLKEAYVARCGAEVKHIFAEPEPAEKTAIGYKEPETVRALLEKSLNIEPTDEEVMAHVIAHQHPIREKFWLGKIGEHLKSDVLFVCGDIHLSTFPKLLKEEHIRYEVIKDRVGVRDLNVLDYRALKYAQDDNMFEADCVCMK
jgi:hypothetical protein